MAYTLAGTTIRRPNGIKETNSTQSATNRTLSGAVSRDFFGSKKRVWTLDYKNLNVTDYTTIQTIYTNYQSIKTPVALSITEGNYVVSANVHVDFLERDFSIPGSSYLSDNTLILTEA